MTTYYVSGAGNDKNIGTTQTKAFRTLSKAASFVKAGDTVLVMNGTYTESDPNKTVLTIYQKQGTAASPITFKAYPGATPVIRAKNQFAINIAGSSHIVVEGLKLIGNKDSITLAYAQSQKNKSSNPLVQGAGIRVGPSYDNGKPKYYSNHVVIRNNAISKFPGGGIGVDTSDYITIENNTISETSWYTNKGNSAISILRSRNSDANVGAYKMIVRNNVIHDNQSLIPYIEAGTITEGHGIILDSNKKTQYRGKFLVANNTVYNNGGYGIQVFSSENTDVVNNTLYQNSRTLNLNGEIAVITSNNVRAENNIMYARTTRRANTIYKSTNVTFNHNLAYNGTFTPSDNPTATGLVNTVGLDPQFVYPSQANFALKAGSPAIDAGSNTFNSTAKIVPVNGDGINGAQTDIGAYEYAGASALTSTDTTGTPTPISTDKPLTSTPTFTTLSIAAASANKAEGKVGKTSFTFSVNREGNLSSATTVNYKVRGSGRHPANAADFGGKFPTSKVRFAAHQTSGLIRVNVKGDIRVEPTETFTVALSKPTGGAKISTVKAIGTIKTDDARGLLVKEAAFSKEAKTLIGTNLSETLTSSAASNRIQGLGGDDILEGGSGDDVLRGGSGNDQLLGKAGQDHLCGDAGDDWLQGNTGDDILRGGSGSDIFVAARGQGTETIRDFKVGTDKIALDGGLTKSDVLIQQQGKQTWLIDNSLHQTIAKLDGVSAVNLSAQAVTTLIQI